MELTQALEKVHNFCNLQALLQILGGVFICSVLFSTRSMWHLFLVGWRTAVGYSGKT